MNKAEVYFLDGKTETFNYYGFDESDGFLYFKDESQINNDYQALVNKSEIDFVRIYEKKINK